MEHFRASVTMFQKYIIDRKIVLRRSLDALSNRSSSYAEEHLMAIRMYDDVMEVVEKYLRMSYEAEKKTMELAEKNNE